MIDPHSYARPSEVVVTHLHLDIRVDFEQEIIEGDARLDIKKAQNASLLRLDTKELSIKEVWTIDHEGQTKKAQFEVQDADPILGSALIVEINESILSVQVRYSTSPHAEALKWLNPQQTAGKKHPFLLTQSQAINARTWIPIQDGPGMRFTYSARVQVPPHLMAVMSATNPTERSTTGIYEFEMCQPIPAYLLALAVGDFTFKSLGPRTGVYAEPVMLEASAYELAEMEDMLRLAEGLYGPYRWDRYDVIVLPPSFPFGGMENPRLTFATPTIIVGDRSLTSLIAHELAHSWSGNLVTNATWNELWINEGFTVYFEYRIMEALKGREYSEMLAQLSLYDLKAEIAEVGDSNPDTHLYLQLEGRNPDDGVTSIPYEKGYYFLRLIANTVGRERFDAFLASYFNAHAFKSMDTPTFLSYIKEHLLTQEEEKQINIPAWIYGPGLPSNLPTPNSNRFEKVEAEIEKWKTGAAATSLASSKWTTHEWLHFIRHLPTPLTESQMIELDNAFGLTSSKNPEIQCAWYQLCLQKGYNQANEAIEAFLIRVGRRKFLSPLYKEMVKTESGTQMAMSIYTKARPNYHPISTNTIDKIVGFSIK